MTRVPSTGECDRSQSAPVFLVEEAPRSPSWISSSLCCSEATEWLWETVTLLFDLRVRQEAGRDEGMALGVHRPFQCLEQTLVCSWLFWGIFKVPSDS